MKDKVLRKIIPTTGASSMQEIEFKRLLRIVVWPILAASLAVCLHASIELRGLYADGAGFVLGIIEFQDFSFPAESRRAVHVLVQWPTVLAVKLGVTEVRILMLLYCLIVQTLPLLFIAICYIMLPKSKKEFIFFPLLHYTAGSMAASFAAVAEAPVAAAYFWMLFYLILFRGNELKMIIILVFASLPAMWLHEVMSFLALLLTFSSIWQARKQPTIGRQFVFWSLTCWFLLIAIVQFGYIVNPVSVENRGSFINDFFKLVWLGTLGRTTNSNIPALNIPALLGIGGILAMLIISLKRLRGNNQIYRPLSRFVIAAYGATCVFTVVAVAAVDWTFVANPQFAARNHPAFVSVPLALLALASILKISIRSFWMKKLNVIILIFLVVASLGWHVVATQYWTGFIQTFRKTLNSYHGLVVWEEILEELPENERATLTKMSWDWTNPILSFLLSPEGKVTTVISSWATARHYEFDPADPNDLPRSSLFDTSAYRTTLYPSSK